MYYFYDSNFNVIEYHYFKPDDEKLKEPHVVSSDIFEDKEGYILRLYVDLESNLVKPVYTKINSTYEVLKDKISILEVENANLREGLQAVLSGDMQSLAYILYPEDFAGVNKSNTTLEL